MGGGQGNDPRSRRVSVAATIFDADTSEVVLLFVIVPGIQTVPRAERWALYQLMIRMRIDIEYTVHR